MQLAHRVAAQVASLCQLRLLTLQCELKTASQKSKGRARGRRPRAGNQGLLAMMTWTPLLGYGAHGSMQHQERQRHLARAPSISVVVVCNVLCAGSQSTETPRALAPGSHRTMRTDNAAVESLAARAIHVAGTASSGQAAVPVSGTVA